LKEAKNYIFSFAEMEEGMKTKTKTKAKTKSKSFSAIKTTKK
jgi:hypothetical protein